MRTSQVVVVDATQMVARALDKAGFGDDSNTETEIKNAGIWNLMDSLVGKGRFSVEQARAELQRRGL